jgi:HAMP domain-containing protein
VRRPTLRRRLYTVLVQWFVLLVIAAGAVLALSFSRLHGDLVDERLLLARTIAHALDETISAAFQNMSRLTSELPALNGEVALQLRAFRFQSPFREATYLLDAQGRVIAADPAVAHPLPPPTRDHEIVTPLLQKAGTGTPGVVALVQPFRRNGAVYYLVSEMKPAGSAVSAFLQGLEPEHEMQVAVIDRSGVVIAAADPQQLFRTLAHAPEYRERIGAHRPLVTEAFSGEFASARRDAGNVLTVMVPLRFAPWGVILQQARAQAFAGLDSTRRGLVGAAIILAVVGVLLARALSRSVVAPIRALSTQAETIRTGDLSQPVRVAGDREVESLARTLDDARQRLAATLGELTALNEGLEQQVAHRTRAIEARVRDVKLLQSVAELSTREHDPDTFVPEALGLIAAHYAFPALALVTRPRAGASVTYVAPAGATGACRRTGSVARSPLTRSSTPSSTIPGSARATRRSWQPSSISWRSRCTAPTCGNGRSPRTSNAGCSSAGCSTPPRRSAAGWRASCTTRSHSSSPRSSSRWSTWTWNRRR